MAFSLLGAAPSQAQFCFGVALPRVGRHSSVASFASLAWSSGSLCGEPRQVIFHERVRGPIKARDEARLAAVRAGRLRIRKFRLVTEGKF